MKITKKRVLKAIASVILTIALFITSTLTVFAQANQAEDYLLINVEIEYDLNASEVRAFVNVNEEAYANGLITDEDIQSAIQQTVEQKSQEDIVFAELVAELSETGEPTDAVNASNPLFWIIVLIVVLVLTYYYFKGGVFQYLVETYTTSNTYGWHENSNYSAPTQYQYQSQYIYC